MGDRVATALVLREAIWEKARHGAAARGARPDARGEGPCD